MKIYLVTHAHTTQERDAVVDVWRLSARGLLEARTLAEAPFWSEVARVIVSSEPKAWLTVAQVVTARYLPVWIDARFDELRRGGWVDDYAARVAAALAAPEHSMGGWEAVGNVRQRAGQALEDVAGRFPGENLALVGHGLCLSILRAALLGQRQVDFAAWQSLPFASVACLDWESRTLLQDFPHNNEARG